MCVCMCNFIVHGALVSYIPEEKEIVNDIYKEVGSITQHTYAEVSENVLKYASWNTGQ